ncbi:MAG: hypothetical protein JSV49_07460 [Thermoplasmata archaeon]|nr:MAG: hypothetical protein JSV49_07460 [Thermoplasmata archaeon]
MFLPWWHLKFESNVLDIITVDYGMAYELTEAYFESNVINEEEADLEDFDYDDWRDEDDSDDTILVFDITFYLVLTAIIFTVISLIAVIVIGVRKSSGKVGMGLLSFTFIIAITIPILFASSLPGGFSQDYDDLRSSAGTDTYELEGADQSKPKYCEDFAGTQKGEYFEMSWGPRLGWYLSIAAFVLIGTSMILTFFPPRAPRETYKGPKPPSYQIDEHLEIKEAEVISEPIVEEKTIECPRCKSRFDVRIRQRPAKIECPFCGVEGEIK